MLWRIAKSLKGIKRRLSIEVGHWLVQKRPDDRYIVSYPRSGNTWVRTMLAYLLRPDAPSNPDIYNTIIPGVSVRQAFHINALPSPRIIKSHSWYRQGIPIAVYLVRDGRDVLVSMYHYMVTRRGGDETFSEFFQLYCQGSYGDLWHQNVESWLKKGSLSMGESLMVVRFEDLKVDKKAVIGKIASFLGIPASSDKLQEAVRSASLERMREVERRRKENSFEGNKSFYRGGTTGQWKDYLTPAIEKKFYELSSQALSLAGYELSQGEVDQE